MKFFMKLILISTFAFQIGCAATPVVLDRSEQLSAQSAEQGEVVNVRQVKLKADWQHTLAIGVLTTSVGNMIADDVGSMAGAFIGNNIANKYYGREVDEITIEDEGGKQYKTLMLVSVLHMQDQVLFKHDGDILIAIARK